MLTRPIRIAVVAGVVTLIVAAPAYLLLPPRQTSDVALPPDDATPEQVVTVYLEALNAHDCETAAALTADDARSSAESWCDDVKSVTEVHVGEHFVEGSTSVVNVPATFDLTWRPFHGDGSMAEGATTWGYRLARDSADAPWRIFDQGTG